MKKLKLKNILFLVFFYLLGCTQLQKEKKIKVFNVYGEKPYKQEVFRVVRQCFYMEIVSVDSCSEEYGHCWGKAVYESQRNLTGYIKFQDWKKPKDRVRYCYIVPIGEDGYLKNGSIHSYFIYDEKPKDRD